MAKISLSSVLDGITLALHEAFPDTKIHGDTVTQNLADGDIQVVGFISGFADEPAEREKATVNVTVAYYPSAEGGICECISAGEKMKKALGMIKTPEGDIIPGLSPSLDIGNGDSPVILSIKYIYFARDMTEDAAIEEFSIKFGGIHG